MTTHHTSVADPATGPVPEAHDVRPRWMRRNAAARYLDLSPGTLANLAACVPRKGPRFYVPEGSRTPLYAIEDLDAYVMGRSHTATGRAA